MKVLVTGANGLLASNTIIELLNRGYLVKGFLRNKEKFKCDYHKNLQLVEGDITKIEDINNAIIDCEFVIHAAAVTNQDLLNYKEYYEVNVQGTKNIIEASKKSMVKKIIYISTANVFGFGTKHNLGDESHKIKFPFSKSLYAKSKLEGQEVVKSNSDKIEVVIVNPTFMIGAYDSKPSSGKIILMGLNKRIIFYPPGGKNFICVKDVSIGIINALKKGVNGEAYLLANENLTYKEFFLKLQTESNKNTYYIKLSKNLLLFIGLIGNLIRKIGIRTSISVENMRALCIHNYYSNKKAKTELGLSFNPIEDGINEAVDWFKKNKMLK